MTIPKEISVRVRVFSSGHDTDTGALLDQQTVSAAGTSKTVGHDLLLHYKEPVTEEGTDETTVSLRCASESLTMLRQGEFSVSMRFRADESFKGFYHTPWGNLPFTLHTDQFYRAGTDAAGEIKLTYTLELMDAIQKREMVISWNEALS